MIKSKRVTTYLASFLAFVVMCCLFVAVGRTANIVSAYKVTPITPPAGWTNVVPTDINNSGQVVGYGFNGTTTQPFIADTRTFTPIGLPPFFDSGFGMAINGSGRITGFGVYTPAPPQPPADQAFTGGIGGITSVFPLTPNPPPGPIEFGDLGAYAFDINDSGEIAGHRSLRGLSCQNGFFRFFTATPSGTISTSQLFGGFGFGINNLGEIAGTLQELVLQPSPPAPSSHCFDIVDLRLFLRDAAGVITFIPLPTGWSAADSCTLISAERAACSLSAKLQINDSEQIAAMVQPTTVAGLPTNGANGVRVALSTRTNSFLIPLPSGVAAVIRPSLNNRGQVVGQIRGGPGGWIWDSSNGTRLLQSLVPPGWTILSADGINDQGQIVARASNNSTGFSGPVILDPEIVNSPDRPTGLTSVCNGASQVTVSWQSVQGATSYYLRINDPATSNLDYSIDSLSQKTYTATVTPGHEYQWWVHAANAGGLSASAQSTFTCPAPSADTTAPMISNIAVTDITPSSASITWKTDEPAYGQVEFSAPCPPAGCLTPFVSAMLTSHRLDVANLTDSTTYSFRIRVKDSSGNTSTSAPQSFKSGALPLVMPTTAPATPTNLAAQCNGGSQVSLRWSPVPTADTYYLRINDLSKATPTPYDYVVDGLRATTFTANVTPGHQYGWWVHAANAIGLSGSTLQTFTCPTP